MGGVDNMGPEQIGGSMKKKPVKSKPKKKKPTDIFHAFLLAELERSPNQRLWLEEAIRRALNLEEEI